MKGPEGAGGAGKKAQPTENPPKDLRGHDEAMPIFEADVSPREWKYGPEKTTSSPESTAEKKADLARAVTAVQEQLAQRAGVSAERGMMLQSEKAYLAAYKDLHKKGLGKADSGPEVENVADLKRAYDAARIAYAEKLTNSAKQRWEKDGLSEGEVAKRLERYNRLVRFNEVVKPTAELQLRARVEGLNEKGRSGWQKGLAWFAKGNQWLEGKMGKKGARVFRAAASAVLVSGGAAAAGAFGSAALMGMAGYGAYKFARTLGGGLIGEGVAKVYEKTLGRRSQEKAREELKKEGRTGDLDARSLAALDKKREKYTKKSDDSTLARNKMIAKILGGFMGGASITEFINLGIVQEAAGFVASEAGQAFEHMGIITPASAAEADHSGLPDAITKPEHDADVRGWKELHPHEPYPGDAKASEVIISAQEKAAEAARAPMESVSADHGAGGIKLLTQLQSKLEHLSADKPALARLANTSPEKLAQQLGLYKPGAEGGLENIEVPKGSTLAYTNSGEVVLTLKNGSSVTLIDAAGHTPAHEGDLGRFIALHHAEHPVTAHHEEAETRALNEAQLKGEPNTVSTASVAPEPHPVSSAPAAEAAPAPHAAPQSTAPSIEPSAKPMPTDGVAGELTRKFNPEVFNNSGSSASESVAAPMDIAAYESMPAEKILEPSAHIPAELHDKIMQVVARTGIGPSASDAHKETIAEYLQRAGTLHSMRTGIAEGHGGLKVPLGETHVYEGPHHTPVVFGGDESARMYVMADYFMRHPGTKVVLVETYDTEGHGRTVPWTLASGYPAPGLPTRSTFFGFGGFDDAPDPSDFRALLS